jgi:hypothetical protein
MLTNSGNARGGNGVYEADSFRSQHLNAQCLVLSSVLSRCCKRQWHKFVTVVSWTGTLAPAMHGSSARPTASKIAKNTRREANASVSDLSSQIPNHNTENAHKGESAVERQPSILGTHCEQETSWEHILKSSSI